MADKRKYFCYFNNQYFEVYPRNTDKLKYTYAQERDQIFYRKKLNGKVVFVNNPEAGITDFTKFRNIEMSSDSCNEIKFEVRRLCNGTYITEWRGYFTTTKGSFDLDQCKFTIEPQIDDEYRCLFDHWDEEVNILDVPANLTTSAFIEDDNFEYYYCRGVTSGCVVCAASLPTPSTSWKLLHYNIDGDSNGAYICIYYRERVETDCISGVPQVPSGAGWQLLTDDCAGSNTSVYVRQPAATFPVPNPNIQTGVCNSGIAEPPPPVTKANVIVTASVGSSSPNDVIGRVDVCDNEQNLFFRVEGADDSTYLWVIGDTTGMINISGINTKQLSFDLQSATANNGTTINCVETTSCGDTIIHTLGVSGLSIHHALSNPYPIPFVNFLQIDGSEIICKNQTGVIFRVPEEFRCSASNITWSVHAGCTIVSGQGSWEIVVDFDGSFTSAFTTVASVSISPNLICVSPPVGTIGKTFSAQVIDAPLTEPIEGAMTVCVNSTTKYRVRNRVGSTYTWYVVAGTINSGQGTNEIEVTWSTAGTREITVKETMTCGCNWRLIVDCETGNDTPYYWCAGSSGHLVLFDDNRNLFDVIDYMISELGCDKYNTEMISDFFERNPVGDAKDYAIGKNYVTLTTNKVDMLSIAQKSDIIDPDATDNADIGMMTFKRMTEILREMFQVYFFLVPESDGTFSIRFEHIKYFDYTYGLNLSIGVNATQNKSQNKYDHLNETLPKYERYKWMEAINTDFIGAEIKYDSLCVSQDSDSNVLNHNVDDVTTDVQAIVQNPEDIDPTGFVILANYVDPNGDNMVISETGVLSGASFPNNHLSWANLHDKYHRYDRVLKFGYMNNVLTEFITFRKNIKQTPLSIGFCCDDVFDPKLLVITELGFKHLGGIYGIVETAELTFKDDVLKLNLQYAFQP